MVRGLCGIKLTDLQAHLQDLIGKLELKLGLVRTEEGDFEDTLTLLETYAAGRRILEFLSRVLHLRAPPDGAVEVFSEILLAPFYEIHRTLNPFQFYKDH